MKRRKAASVARLVRQSVVVISGSFGHKKNPHRHTGAGLVSFRLCLLRHYPHGAAALQIQAQTGREM